MRTLFVAFLLTSLAVSLAFGEVNPNSVHPGYKKAIDNGDITTAVNLRRNGVSDIYCPASLSSGDAVKLYRNELRNAPETIIKNCSPEFIEKIAVKSCANPKNIKLCKAILGQTKIPKWIPMLEKIVENEVYNESPYFNEEMDKAFSTLIDYESYNPFLWSGPILSLIEKAKLISSNEHNEGASACIADISCYAQMNTDLYIKNGFIPDEVARFSCRVHPGIDKKISEEKGLNILNCDDIFALYSDKCGSTPQIVAKNRLDGQGGVSYYKCDGDAKGWHRVDAVEAGKGTEPCTDDRIGELKQSELDFRIFRCGENHQWNTYAIKMGNTIWAIWDVRKGGTSPGKKIKEFLKEVEHEDLFEKIGHTYTYKEAENVCPDGWQLPTIEQFDELKSMVQPIELLSEDWDFTDWTNSDKTKKTNKWNFNARWSFDGDYLDNKAIYWGKDGATMDIFEACVEGDCHYEMDVRKSDLSKLNDRRFNYGRMNVRCVKSDNNLGKVKTTAKRNLSVVATASSADDEKDLRSANLKNQNQGQVDAEDYQKQESASAAVESAKQDESTINTTKLLRIIVSSAAVLGGGVAALVFDKKAKDATATPPTNEQEFKKGHDEGKRNQNARNFSLGLFAAGVVALGISILF